MAGLITLLIVGLVFAGFAAAAETSLTSVSRIRMRTLAEEGNKRAGRVVQLHNDPNAYLSTILTLNTVAIIVSSTSTALLVDSYWHGVPQALGTAVLSLVVLMFCEIAPKSLALRFNERLALVFAAPVTVITRVLRPIVGGLTAMSRLLLRAATRGRKVRGPFVTEEELKMLVYMGEQEGIVEQEEVEMIHGILEMTDKAVREVMVPRIDVVAIEHDRPVSDLIQLIVEHGHSRIPVYEESIDHIVGVVYAKDLLTHGVRSDDTRPLREIARDPYYTPEAKRVGELLHDMQERKVHIAIVVEEHGGTAGIVTFEDLIEEIVGPIRDEYDVAEEEEVQIVSDHEALVTARASIDDVRELLNVDVGDVDADSMGGLVYERLGEIPKPGDTVQLGDATLTVLDVQGQNIRTVRITSPEMLVRERARNGTGAADAVPDESSFHSEPAG
ncbi:MAG: HlyC/CorC family transporter [Candidatus Dormibacteraeota bacterium]|nr:HlyC/CorC family transporter [Candidatus Dormibacteraeota bacterium]MBV8444848.1 HlyC/CorC family transporter [Candidatus Dormibacteraeota bacterium]